MGCRKRRCCCTSCNYPLRHSCAKADGGWNAYQKKGKWQAAARASRSAATAERLNEEAGACYAACKAAHEAAQAYAAGRVLHRLAGELRDVLTLFDTAKRQAALVDFDDLMLKARDLLAGNATVRAALAARYTAVLVDEFQDTDRLQGEILWRLCAAAPDPAAPWTEWPLRPGALFLVGDPKQAIYRFRGADVASYVAARDRLTATDADARLVIGQNFRSYGLILDWVNERFAAPLAATGQPGFERLFTNTAAPDGHVAVATLPIPVEGGSPDHRRDAEAEAVAAFCARVIGALPVRGRDGQRPCQPDDIALLAPTGTELWRYERALEQAGISVSTQAGKGFFRRQEVQDLIALARTLADTRDTLALGALLRGPLVGLTEEALLDATDALPPWEDGRPGRLSLWTPLEDVRHVLLRETLAILQGLARGAGGTTPFVLLCQAVEEMQVRPLLRRRLGGAAERALANIDQFLEAARPYDLRGLPAFAQAMTAQWKDAQRSMEGRPDTEQQSVSLVTMHASKGLEWPVVVPVNMGGELKAPSRPHWTRTDGCTSRRCADPARPRRWPPNATSWSASATASGTWPPPARATCCCCRTSRPGCRRTPGWSGSACGMTGWTRSTRRAARRADARTGGAVQHPGPSDVRGGSGADRQPHAGHRTHHPASGRDRREGRSQIGAAAVAGR